MSLGSFRSWMGRKDVWNIRTYLLVTLTASLRIQTSLVSPVKRLIQVRLLRLIRPHLRGRFIPSQYFALLIVNVIFCLLILGEECFSYFKSLIYCFLGNVVILDIEKSDSGTGITKLGYQF